MVCARLIDCPDSPEEEEMGPIPDMMFAGGEEPVGVRVLTYQSSTVPSLTEGVQEIGSSSESDSEEIEGNGRDIFTKKQNLNPAHARNVDKRGNVYVCSILCEDSTRPIDEGSCEWSDEEEDFKVDNLVALINANHEFQTSQFRGGVRKSDVDRMRQRSKLTSKGRKSSNVQSNSERFDPGNVASLVIEKITPQLAIMDKNINLACAMVDAIEGKVVVHVDDLFVKLKEEMIKCVKDMVSAMVKDVFEGQNGPSNIPSAAPPEAAALSTHSTPARDLNANTIENVLRNLSDYSTPPRSKHMTQVNLPSTNKDDVATGFVCVTPQPETCAQSANSENRTRQISLQQRLEAYKRQEHNITDEPSFSLGLTQEEMNQGQLNMVPAEVPLRNTTSEMNVDDNIAEVQVSRKSKRQRTVPSTLVDDYQCGRHIMTRVRESQKFVFPLDSISEMERKYVQLSTKLNDKFTVNVAGLFASGKDIRLILERSRFMSAKVIDILIRVVRRSTLLHLSEEGRSSVALLDTKFVAAINKTFPKFVKSRNKEGYMFPKGLRDIFPSANDAAVHPTRYYFPCNLGNKHWVGICFDAGIGVITVLDCNISLYKERSLETDLKPIVQMLPYLARFACQPIGDDNVIQCYDVARPKFVSQNKNPSDSGLMAVLLMANHAVYGTEACKNIGHERLEAEGRRAAILMSTALRVRLAHGAWDRNDDGHWTFQRKPTALGYTVLIKPTETLEDLETIIRDRLKLNPDTPLVMAYHPPEWLLEPEGTRTPPTTLTSTAAVEEMMSLRSWFLELTLYVSSGAEDVGYYQFLCETTLTIGGATFVFEGLADNELVASKEILEEIFSEQETVGIYKAHFQIENAKKHGRQNAASSSVASNEVTGEGSASSPPASED
ncbi:hypothetical protein IGI04_026237 [Brassica rapa subsp. trilocularis]|uniref:Ubiquitin-like protease family profile domain-containing protein n=1 Tax=Brassica rapa subsp. trilocularis TaxID=1813537 RepID=A0ABQ7KY36_BRACM|nr:hypothetical protein IGI04_026237 [Brassica rapa subsp. trilocularis]